MRGLRGVFRVNKKYMNVIRWEKGNSREKRVKYWGNYIKGRLV